MPIEAYRYAELRQVMNVALLSVLPALGHAVFHGYLVALTPTVHRHMESTIIAVVGALGVGLWRRSRRGR